MCRPKRLFRAEVLVEGSEFSAGGDAEFGEDVTQVGADGAETDAESA